LGVPGIPPDALETRAGASRVLVDATADDIPWLKLEVVNRRGSGALADATTVQRIHTRGGGAQGACDRAGTFLSVPYSADYVFLRNGG
jgi:Protein of unknown function (DUF3455)